MIMVLNLHSFWGYEHGSGIWQALDFFRETTSICAVDCFVLISGYFGIRWKRYSFFNLIFQIFFYSIGLYLAVVALGIVNWNLKDFLLRFACLITQSWDFAITYVILYFCAPLLNAFSEKTTSRELFLYILVFFMVINFICIPRQDIFTYTLVYLIGRLLRKVKIEEKNISAGKAYLLTTFIIFLLVYCVIFKTFNVTSADKVQQWPIGLIGYNYAAPLILLQAVFLFAFFSRIKFNNDFINKCALSCFAIFLIHMHPTIKEIGYYSFTESLYGYSVIKHILILIILMFLVFIGSILIDQIRIIISNSLYLFLKKAKAIIPKTWVGDLLYMHYI